MKNYGGPLLVALLFVIYQTWSLVTLGQTYNDDQNSIYLMTMRQMEPGFLAQDYAYGNPRFLEFYTPVYLLTLRALTNGLGSYDTAIIFLHTVLLSGYLVTMFVLLCYVCGDTFVAVIITLLSALVRPAIASEFWGSVGLQTVIPRTAFLALTPLLFLLLFRWLPSRSRWQMPLLGLLGGLATNLHPPSGLFFLQIVLTMLLVFNLSRLKTTLGQLLLTGLAWLVGAFPTFWPIVRNLLYSEGSRPDLAFGEFVALVKTRLISGFPFPASQMMLPGGPISAERQTTLIIVGVALSLLWVVVALWQGRQGFPHARGLIIALLVIVLPFAYLSTMLAALDLIIVTAAYWAARLLRRDWDRLDLYALAVLACTALYSFAGSGVLAWVWESFEIWALTSFYGEQARMARLVYLPLYLFMARWLVLLLRQSRQPATGAVIAAGLVAGMVVRHWHFRDVWHAPEWGLGVCLLLLALAGIALLLKRPFPAWADAVIMAVCAAATGYFWLYIVGVPISAWLASAVGAIAGAIFFYGRMSVRGWQAAAIIVVLAPLLWLLWQGPVAVDGSAPLRVQAYKALGLYQYAPPDEQDLDRQAMYAWIRKNTPPDAVFYYDDRQLEFRAGTHRAVTHSWKDLGGAYYTPHLLQEYFNRYQRIEAGYQAADTLIATANEFKAAYIVTRPDQPELPIPPAFANAHYRVYQVAAPSADSAAGP